MFVSLHSDYDAGIFNRLFVLESRASLKQTLGQLLYFPLIFFMFGVIVGKLDVQSLYTVCYFVFCFSLTFLIMD